MKGENVKKINRKRTKSEKGGYKHMNETTSYMPTIKSTYDRVPMKEC